jgi:hypothetical protein
MTPEEYFRRIGYSALLMSLIDVYIGEKLRQFTAKSEVAYHRFCIPVNLDNVCHRASTFIFFMLFPLFVTFSRPIEAKRRVNPYI